MRVADVLARPLFRGARVAAGAEGLSRRVRVVHVGEIPDLARFLSGGELILTTGFALTTAAARQRFIEGIHGAGASGLVLELGSSWRRVPPDLAALCDALSLPLVVFDHAVRFVDLAQDVNTALLSARYTILEEIARLTETLAQHVAHARGPAPLLDALHAFLGLPVAVVWDTASATERVLVRGAWPVPYPWDTLTAPPETYRSRPIRCAGVREGVLWAAIPGAGPSNRAPEGIADVPPHIDTPDGGSVDLRVELGLERTAHALAQDRLRLRAAQGAQRRAEGIWLHRLVEGGPQAAEAAHRLVEEHRLGGALRARDGTSLLRQAALWCIGPVPRDADSARPTPEGMETLAARAQALVSSAMSTRVVVDGQDVWCLVVQSGAAMDTLLPAADCNPSLPERVAALLDARVGVSSLAHTGARLAALVEEARLALRVAVRLGVRVAHYSELGPLRLFAALPEERLWHDVVRPELGPLLGMGEGAHPSLVETLCALEACDFSRREAAALLGIRRQTLYRRLEKIEKLTGVSPLTISGRRRFSWAVLALPWVDPARLPEGLHVAWGAGSKSRAWARPTPP